MLGEKKKMMVNPSNDGDSEGGGGGGGEKPGGAGGEEEERRGRRRRGINTAANYRHSRSNSSCVSITKETRIGEEEDKRGCISDDDEGASVESNDSVCFYCGGGGEIICCEGCPYSFHSDCLQPTARPQQKIHSSSSLGRKASYGNEEEDEEEEDWFCPECLTRFFRNLSKESYRSLSPSPPLPSRNLSFTPVASSSSPLTFSPSSSSSSSSSDTTVMTLMKSSVEEKTEGRNSRLGEHPFTSTTTLSREDEDTTLLFNSPPNQQLLQDSLSWATLPSHLKSILKLHHKRKAILSSTPSPHDHLSSSENPPSSRDCYRGRSPSECSHDKIGKRNTNLGSSSPGSSSSIELSRGEEKGRGTVNEQEEAEKKRRGDSRKDESSPAASVQGVADGKLNCLEKRRREKQEENNDEEEREGQGDFSQEVSSSSSSWVARQHHGSHQTSANERAKEDDEQTKFIGSSFLTSEENSHGKATSSVASGKEESSKAHAQPSSSVIENRGEEATERSEGETEGEDNQEGKQHGVSTPDHKRDRDHSGEKEGEAELNMKEGEKQGEHKEKEGENKEKDGACRGSDERKKFKEAEHRGEEGDFEDVSVSHHRACCSVRTPGVDDAANLASPQLSPKSIGDSSSPKQMEKKISSLSTSSSFVEQQCQARPDSVCSASSASNTFLKQAPTTSSSPPSSSQGGSSDPSSSSSSSSSSQNSTLGPLSNDPLSSLPPTRCSSSSSQPVTSHSIPSSSCSTARGGVQSPPTSVSSAPPPPFCSPFSSSSYFTRHPSIPYPYPYPAPAPYADEELPTFARRRRKKGSSGSKINVGPDHQVPQLPSFYLAQATDVFMSSITSNESSVGIFTSAYNPLCCIYCGGGVGRGSRGSDGCFRNSRSYDVKGEDDDDEDDDGGSCKKEKIRKRILNGYPLLPWDICPYCCRFSSAFFSVDIRTSLPFNRQYSHSSSILKEGVLLSPPLTYPSPPSCSYFSTLFSPPLHTFSPPFPPPAPPLSFSTSLVSHLSRSSSPPTSSAFIRRPFPDPNLHRKKTFSSRADSVGEKSSSCSSSSSSCTPFSSSYSSLTSKKGDCISSTSTITTHHSFSPVSAPLPSLSSSSLLRSQSLSGRGFLWMTPPPAERASTGLYQSLLEPTLVYSPSSLERKRKLCTALGRSENCINTQTDLADFIATCSRHWKASPGWQPFTPEFAYKLLHRAEYDPERALRMLDDSAFSFNDICDPPLRRYDNKWKRRDKRGTYPCSPYPSPAVIRHYLGEKLHTKHHRTL